MILARDLAVCPTPRALCDEWDSTALSFRPAALTKNAVTFSRRRQIQS